MRPITRTFALAALAVALGPAGSAAGQALPPSLTVDTNYAFSGVVEYDFTPGVSEDLARGAGIDTALDRHYAVGEAVSGGSLDVAVVARRASGALDSTFDGDGKRTLDLATALALVPTMPRSDSAASVAVLPDHRLRIAADIEIGGTRDIVVVGLLPDGKLDLAFGTRGVKRIMNGQDDAAAAIVAGSDGRLAIAGSSTNGSGEEDTFVAALEDDGTPVPGFGADGFVTSDVGDGADDRGADVVWGAQGPVVLVETDAGLLARTAILHAFTATGDDDTTFAGTGSRAVMAGGVDITAGGLVAYDGRLWATGSVQVGDDIDAYLARFAADGSDEQVRRFDMRGTVFPASQQVASVGEDLTIVPGEPDTLVVGGSVTTDSGTEVGAAAFNLLDGPLATLQAVELAIPVPGQGAAVGVAGGTNGALALTADMLNAPVTGGGSDDASIGMARILVDDEKRCDLGLSVVAPLELLMRGVEPSPVTLRATNNGQRACGGAITAPAPYTTAPAALPTGKLGPGQSTVVVPSIAYGAPLPADDTLSFTLVAPGDAALGDNEARLHVLFSFCDLQLHRVGGPRALGFEGAQRYDFTVRNSGTADCRGASIAVGGSGRRALATKGYTVPPGQSVTDEVMVAVRRRLVRPGARAPISFAVSAAGDVQAANDVQAHAPLVVRVGDTTARRPKDRGRLFTGTAKPARKVPGVKRRDGRVARVEIAIRRAGKRCKWLAAAAGGLRPMPKGLGGTCDQPVWVRVKGTGDWRLRIRRALPKGRYTLLSRAVTRNGAVEGAFSFKDQNRIRFRIQ